MPSGLADRPAFTRRATNGRSAKYGIIQYNDQAIPFVHCGGGGANPPRARQADRIMREPMNARTGARGHRTV
jgi:hypothetical protein